VSATVCTRDFSASVAGLIVEEETLYVLGVGFDVVGWQDDGAAGEPGFRALWDEAALPASVLGPVESCALARFASFCASDDIKMRSFGRIVLRGLRAPVLVRARAGGETHGTGAGNQGRHIFF